MMKKLKIALGQLLIEGGEPERNIERAEELIFKANQEKCDMILLPECLDYGWTHPSSIKHAKTIPGKFSDQFSIFAKKYKIFVCLGLTEKDPNLKKNYNTAILIDDLGKIILKYQKINILEEAFDFYSPGKKLEVIETKFGNIGINICSDNYKDAIDIGLVLGRMGADIILSPSSWTVDYHITEDDDPYKNKWIEQFITLSKIFNIPVISTTSVGYIVGGPYEGKKMIGCSLATDINGLITKGDFNEFASDLKVIEIDICKNKIKGTQVGKKLKLMGIYH
jgi:predicted amidohydrolase